MQYPYNRKNYIRSLGINHFPTIRYYEKLGLISVKRKERRDNNYKEYCEAVLTQLQSIHRLKEMGFTLAEISRLLDKMDITKPVVPM